LPNPVNPLSEEQLLIETHAATDVNGNGPDPAITTGDAGFFLDDTLHLA